MSILSKIKSTYKGLCVNATRIAALTNKRRIYIMFDMIACLVKYAASPNNYEKFEFYNLTSAQRATYVTYGISRRMIKKFNNSAEIDVFENKQKFAKRFSDLYKREYLSVEDMNFATFQKFCYGKDKFICKPYAGAQGQNIKVFYLDDNIQTIFNTLKSHFSEGYMLEEWIPQHSVLAKIYPNAVNCVRIITIYDGVEMHIITGGVTFGVSTEIANASQPSIVAPIDFETGVLYKPAANFNSELYVNHPTTGERIVDVQLPFWIEIKEMLTEACKRVPSVGYIGWDIAITPTGPLIIEGNTTPGYNYYQIPAHLENGIGNKEKYTRYLH